MAVVSILDAFGYKWAQTGTAEALTDDQWKAGWAFIGALPPSVEQFNKWGQISDEKSNYLYAQLKAVFDQAGAAPSAVDPNTLRDALAALLSPGRFLGVQVFTNTGAYTPTAGTKAIVVEGVGGGAGGTGVPATGGGAGAVGGGGGSGASFKVLIRTGFSGATVTIGTGGAGVVGSAGIAGGATSFGTFATAPGGANIAAATPQPPPNISGGASPSAAATASPGVGGLAIALSRGLPGGYGVFAANGNGISGAGAPSIYGPGGQSSVSAGGAAGFAPGSGGSGGLNNFSSAANAGGPGVAGQVIVWEYA